jgi:hypothetical protein
MERRTAEGVRATARLLRAAMPALNPASQTRSEPSLLGEHVDDGPILEKLGLEHLEDEQLATSMRSSAREPTRNRRSRSSAEEVRSALAGRAVRFVDNPA